MNPAVQVIQRIVSHTPLACYSIVERTYCGSIFRKEASNVYDLKVGSTARLLAKLIVGKFVDNVPLYQGDLWPR